MFVLVHKGRVLVGPMGWNRAMFDGNLEKLGIRFTLPRFEPESLPLTIDENTTVKRVEFAQTEYNQKTQYLEGPYWDHSGAVSIASYQVKDQPIDSVRARLKETLAENRWKREVAGTKTTIQNLQVTVDTARGSRDVFVQKYLLMAEDATVTWKFPEGWLTLTKSELGQAIQAGAAHVESAFKWESDKAIELDNCRTLTELDIVLLDS